MKSPALPSTFTMCLAGGDAGQAASGPQTRRAHPRPPGSRGRSLTVGEEAGQLVDLAAEDVAAQRGGQRLVANLRGEARPSPRHPGQPAGPRPGPDTPRYRYRYRSRRLAPVPPPLTCTSTFTYMSGCDSTVSPEPSSTCEAESAIPPLLLPLPLLLPPRRHGPEGHGRRFRFRPRYFRRARRPLPARVAMATRPAPPTPPSRPEAPPWRRGPRGHRAVEAAAPGACGGKGSPAGTGGRGPVSAGRRRSSGGWRGPAAPRDHRWWRLPVWAAPRPCPARNRWWRWWHGQAPCPSCPPTTGRPPQRHHGLGTPFPLHRGRADGEWLHAAPRAPLAPHGLPQGCWGPAVVPGA